MVFLNAIAAPKSSEKNPHLKKICFKLTYKRNKNTVKMLNFSILDIMGFCLRFLKMCSSFYT